MAFDFLKTWEKLDGYSPYGEKEKLQEKAMALATKVYEQAAKDREQASNDDKEDEEEKPSKKNKKDDDVKEADIEEE